MKPMFQGDELAWGRSIREGKEGRGASWHWVGLKGEGGKGGKDHHVCGMGSCHGRVPATNISIPAIPDPSITIPSHS